MRAEFNRAHFVTSATTLAGLPPDRGREAAFVGRSNAGKSSALNALTGITGLARVSRTPGRTQAINVFNLDSERRLLDLPGYGYARVPPAVQRQWGELMQAYFASRQALAGLVVIMDSRRPLTAADRQLLDWLAPRGLPVLALLTKADKLGRGEARATEQSVARELDGRAEVRLFSALSRQGVEEARGVIGGWLFGK